jgi:hypothetical protein
MSESANLTIRFYQPGDEEGIVELLKKTFPKWNNFKDPLGLWNWKYINSPKEYSIIVLLINNKIVGCSHHIIFKAKLGSEIESIEWGDDLAVDNEYRGKGFWGKMRDFDHAETKDPIKYTYSTTISPIVLGRWRRRGRGEFPFTVSRMVKIKDIDLHLKMRPVKDVFSTKYGYSLLRIWNRLKNIFASKIKHNDDFKIIEIKEFDVSVDSLWNKIKDDYNLILERKSNYINWRFTDNDRGNHIKFQATKGNEVLGYIVLGLKEEGGYTEGQIEDLIALKSRVDVADALFAHANKYFDEHGINTIYYQVVDNHPYHGISMRKGFIESPSKPIINFGYSGEWKRRNGLKPEDKPKFLESTVPSQVCFNYAETV